MSFLGYSALIVIFCGQNMIFGAIENSFSGFLGFENVYLAWIL